MRAEGSQIPRYPHPPGDRDPSSSHTVAQVLASNASAGIKAAFNRLLLHWLPPPPTTTGGTRIHFDSDDEDFRIERPSSFVLLLVAERFPHRADAKKQIHPLNNRKPETSVRLPQPLCLRHAQAR
eukprot:6903444-Prymnesium_polylepis.1